jgi:NAD+ kinase
VSSSSSLQFKTVAIIGKYQAQGIGKPLRAMAACICRLGADVVFERETGLNVGIEDYPLWRMGEIGQRADVAVVLGGDGTVLGVGRELAGFDIPLIGVNFGRLGFLTDLPFSDLHAVLPDILAGQYTTDRRCLLEGRIIRDAQTICSALALNDVVVNRSGMSGMVELAVSVDGHFMYNQRSDGLIISTPTGSTAYALAAGGPILHPSLNGLVMVPIAPHALSNRPIVLPQDANIIIEVVGGRDLSVNFDMQSVSSLLIGDKIEIRRARKTITLLHPLSDTFFDTLREKLYWHQSLPTPNGFRPE